MTGAGNGPELALIEQSVQSANARIRFFRVAFGAAGAEHVIGRRELGDILDDTYRGGRISLTHALPDEMRRSDAKLALLLLLCLDTTLPTGGTLRLQGGENGWHMRAEGKRLRIEGRLWEAITATRLHDDFSAAEVQFALLPEATARAERALSVSLGETAINISF